MRLKRLLLMLIAATVLMPCLYGQQVDVKSLLSSITAQLGEATSLGYTYIQGSEDNGNYVKTLWRESGDKFYLEYINENKDGAGAPFRTTLAYDGTNGYRLSEDKRRLWIKKGAFDQAKRYVSAITPLFPFIWMLPPGEKGNLKALSDPQNVTRLVQRIKIDTGLTEIDKHACAVVHVTNSGSPDSREPVQYKVYCAKALGWFPIAWEVATNKGDFMYSFVCAEVKEIKTERGASGRFIYASVAKIMAAPVAKANTGPGVRRITFTDIHVNTFNDDDFVIDPSIAEVVEDITSDTLITVPK